MGAQSYSQQFVLICTSEPGFTGNVVPFSPVQNRIPIGDYDPNIFWVGPHAWRSTPSASGVCRNSWIASVGGPRGPVVIGFDPLVDDPDRLGDHWRNCSRHDGGLQ